MIDHSAVGRVETRTLSRSRLAREAITQDLIGADVLLQAMTPSAPTGYELIDSIGRGGCGEVFLARDQRLDRLVAIKFLHDAGPSDLERFRREARLTARLNNPAIVQVYELGDVDEQPYIAMQYLDGGNLLTAQLTLPEIIRIMSDVARALHHAHREGIVHRDIKPANILLDAEKRAYITDFGVARDLRNTVGETISHNGQVIGTPGLMPPEQARGDLHAIDGRSDVYALGATLFVKLTGQYPFRGESLVDVLHAVIHNEPPLPRSMNSDIPRNLESIVMRCLSKAREDRYANMLDVAESLDHVLDQGQRGMVSEVWLRRRISGEVDGATQDSDDPSYRDPYWTIGIEIIRDISQWDASLYRVSGSLDRAFGRLAALRHRLDEMLQDRPDMAWARFYRGVVLFREGKLDRALDDMERSIDRMKDLAGSYFELGRLYLALYLRDQKEARKHISIIGTQCDLEEARGRLEQAVVAFREAQRLKGDLAGWHRAYATAVVQLADDDFAGCVRTCDQIIAGDPDIEDVWKLRGDAINLNGGDPFESYTRALDIRRTYFEALHSKALAHLERDQLAEARESLRRACQIHSGFVEATALLAQTYLTEARNVKTGAALEEGCSIARKATQLNPQSFDAAVTLAELLIENADGDTASDSLLEAEAALQRARSLRGCQNRTNLLHARILLKRARLMRDQGVDPQSLIDDVYQLCQCDSFHVPDNDPWVLVKEEADSLSR